MPRKQPGLPEGFKLDGPDAGPVQLGDYLDEDTRARRPKVVERRVVQEPEPVAHEPVATAPEPEPVVDTVPNMDNRSEQLPTRERPRPKRIQMNLSHQGQDYQNKLLDYVAKYSSQKDVAASDLYQALLQNAYDAMRELDLSSLPPRGQWGSPNAKAFRDGLAEAFKLAAVTHFSKLYEQEKRETG